jgi:hypothetical protein
MKSTKKLSWVLVMLFAINFMQAQQTPSKTKKTPAKATAGKKPQASKKAAMVFICEGTNGYTYHARRTCAKLAKCNGKITEVSKNDAVHTFGKEPCKNCN